MTTTMTEFTLQDAKNALGTSNRTTQTINPYSDKPRLQNLLCYVLDIAKKNHISGQLEAIKLNKILWFCDRFSFVQYHQTISSLSYYIRKPYGPMIPDFYPMMNDMKQKGMIEITKLAPHTFGVTQYSILQSIDAGFLTDGEKEIVDEVTDVIVNNYNADEISEKSHQFCWQSYSENDHIPIASTVLETSLKKASPDTMQWARESISDIIQ